MSGDQMNLNSLSPEVAVSDLPKTALQAIYHAVTGKTENYSKITKGNVIIRGQDVDRLYETIVQQIEHYTIIADPTVTIIVKTSKNKTFQYSSWARFKAINVNSSDITSEIAIKVEFVAELPNTDVPQRCVVNILLDSSLPIFEEMEQEAEMAGSTDMLFFFSGNWSTVKTSIDFVDFLVARVFLSHVEEWFDSLETIKKNELNTWLAKNGPLITSFLSSGAQIGFAIFLIGYAYFHDVDEIVFQSVVYAISIAMIIWALFSVVVKLFTRRFVKRIARNLLPTVILLTDADNSFYEAVKSRQNSASTTVSGIIGTVLFAVAINLFSSWLYTAWSKDVVGPIMTITKQAM